MATLSTSRPTLLDHAKRMDPDGGIAAVVEILSETNEILDDMVWVEGNLATGHVATVRTGLPTPTWRKLNQGVNPTKSRTDQITYTCGMLEDYAEVDVRLANLNGNAAAFRLSEDAGHLEGMSQELADTLMYGNETSEPEAFTGLSPHYNDLSAENADNIIVGGGSGVDNASIWLVVWGERTVFGFFPKGSQAGMMVTDKGQVTIEDADGSNGGRMEAYRTHYALDAGLCVRDWRYAVRIPNIDKSALTADASAGANLPRLMFQALDRIPPGGLSRGRAAWYMSRNTLTYLRMQHENRVSGSTLRTEDVGGVMVTTFQGIPLRRVDAMAADEALVS